MMKAKPPRFAAERRAHKETIVEFKQPNAELCLVTVF
jgi:hypothetical protein